MCKKLKRLICFIAAFALAFITFKPVSIKAVDYDEDDLIIVANDDGTLIVSDYQGNPMNNYQIPDDWFWGGSYFNADTEYFGHFDLDEGQPLGNFNWKDRLKHEGAPAGDYVLQIYLLKPDQSGQYDAIVQKQGVIEGLTLITNYTVVFDSSDFSGSYAGAVVSTQNLSSNQSPVLPNDPVRDGYDLEGWYLYSTVIGDYSWVNQDGCEADYKFGTAEMPTYVDGVVCTFRANWVAKAADPAPDEQKVYNILEGGDQTITQGSGNDLVVRADGEFIACTGIFVDGEAFEDSTITAGSTIVTIKAAVLDKMAVGTHKLTFAFKDGVATTTFTLKAAEKTTEVTTEASTAAPATVTTTEAAKTTTTNTASPKTGDEGIMIYGILMLLSLAGMVGISLKKKDN